MHRPKTPRPVRGVIENGIDLMRDSDLSRALEFGGMEREPTVGTCAICGGPLTQGECLRCLVGLGFLSDSQQPDKVENSPTIDTWAAEVRSLRGRSRRGRFSD